MKELLFNVSGQRVKKSADFGSIVRGSKGYLRLRFSFGDSDWRRSKHVCVFVTPDGEDAVAIERDGTCAIPDNIAGLSVIKFYLVAALNDSRIKTNTVYVRQVG